MNLDAMRAFLKAREPSKIVPLEQFLVDLGVYDGMPIASVDVVPELQRKLSKATIPVVGIHSEPRVVDFTDPVVSVDQKLVDGRMVATLRISAQRV